MDRPRVNRPPLPASFVITKGLPPENGGEGFVIMNHPSGVRC